MKNWKTTLWGIIVLIAQVIVNKTSDKPILRLEDAPSVSAAVGLMVARDAASKRE